MRTTAIEAGELSIVDRDPPRPTGRQVRVRVTATGVNRADLLQLAGRYPAPDGVPADVPGLEFAGVVDELGPRATGWSVGDRVMGLVGGGGHAEALLTEDDQLVAVPDDLDDVTAGASVEVFATAHDALVTQAGMTAGDTVLIHAVGSGVGTAAVQLCRALGAIPLGTTRTASKIDEVTPLGLEAGVVVPDPTDREVVDEVAAMGAPDIVLDLVGGDYVALDCRVAAPGARIVVVGLLAGASTEVPLGHVLSKRLEVRGTVLRSRSPWEKARVAQAFGHQVAPLLASGDVAPVIDSTYPLAEAAAAYDRVAYNDTVGKVCIRLLAHL